MTETKKKKVGLELMREKFPERAISKLPKPTRSQTDAVKNDFKAGVRCEVCGGWHHPKVIHLDYVGHAALTDRLLECDDKWSWEPVSFDEHGAPYQDKIGGFWINLTVCGVTRLGYGNPDGKTGGNAVKEAIGDALRNAAMRFGAALDLWHKGDLHDASQDDDSTEAVKKQPLKKEPVKEDILNDDEFLILERMIKDTKSLDELKEVMVKVNKSVPRMNDAQKKVIIRFKDKQKKDLDNIPEFDPPVIDADGVIQE